MNRCFAVAKALAACAVVLALAPGPAGAESATLAAAEALHGKVRARLLPIIERLAAAQRQDGALDRAAALRRRALAIAVAVYGSGSPPATRALAALAALEIDRGRYLDAEPLLLIAEKAARGRSAVRGSTVAVVDAGLARVALAEGDPARAEVWGRKAVAAMRAARSRSASPLRALGAALTGERQFAAAERVLGEALRRDRAQFGGDGIEAARSLSLLGNLYLRWSRPVAALPLLQQAAAIDQRRLGPSHPFIADDFYDIGLAETMLGRRPAAQRAFLAAVAILERGADRDTPRLAYAERELSRLYREAGDDRAAEAASKVAKRILDKAAAEEHARQRRV